MAVQHPNSVLTYSGNGSDAEAYPVSFRFLSNIEVKVAVKDPASLEPELLSEGQDYTLTIFRDSDNVITGGEVVTDIAYGSSILLFIYREVELTQLTELPEFGPFPANALEMSLDKAVMALQQQDRAIKRCFRVSDFSEELEAPYPRPNTVLGISADNDLRLFDGSELLSLIQLPGSEVNAPTAYWLNDFDRELKVPDFIGQLGLELDSHGLYRSTGLTAGDWMPLLLNEDEMTSSSTDLPPSQASVKMYVDAKETSLKVYADAAANTAETNAQSYTDDGLATRQPISNTLCRLTPRDYQPPAAAWARLSTRNSVSTLRFSDSTAEYAIFVGILPHGLSFSSLEVRLFWTAASATTGSVVWHANLEKSVNIAADAWLPGSSTTTAASVTSGVVAITSLTPSVGSLQEGDLFRVRVFRDATQTTDNMTGDAELIAVEIRRIG